MRGGVWGGGGGDTLLTSTFSIISAVLLLLLVEAAGNRSAIHRRVALTRLVHGCVSAPPSVPTQNPIRLGHQQQGLHPLPPTTPQPRQPGFLLFSFPPQNHSERRCRDTERVLDV